MAEIRLPSTTSIIDFLNTQGKDSSFSARKKYYTDLGFDKRLGSYQGSANQNLSLLKYLQNDAKPPQTEAPASSATSIIYDTSKMKPGTNQAILDIFKTPGQMSKVPVQTPTPTPPAPSMNTSSALKTLGVSGYEQPTPQPEQKPALPKASDVLPPTPGEDELLTKFMDSQEGKNLLSDAENKGLTEQATTQAAKDALEVKYKSEAKTLEEKLASNGLAFSGIRGAQVKALADSLAASLLGEDRKLASKLLDEDANLRDAIIKGVADLAKDAKDGRKEAIQQLNAIGYAVVNDQLVPTLSYQSGQRAEEAAIRAEKQLAISEQRLQLAEESAARAEKGNKLTLSEVTAKGLPASLVGTSEQDLADSFYSPSAPVWFQEKFSNENPAYQPPYSPLETSLIQKAWNVERQGYITGVTDSTTRAKATSYFSSAYGDSINQDQMKALVDRVELYVNQGNTYADAMQKVIDEAS